MWWIHIWMSDSTFLLSLIYLHWSKINMIIKFHLNLEDIKTMPVGTMVLLLFLLALSAWEHCLIPAGHLLPAPVTSTAPRQSSVQPSCLEHSFNPSSCSYPALYPCSCWLWRCVVTCSTVPSFIPVVGELSRILPSPRKERRSPQDEFLPAHLLKFQSRTCPLHGTSGA